MRKIQLAFIGGSINSAVGYAHFSATQLDGQFNILAGCFSKDHKINLRTAEVYGVSPGKCYDDIGALLENEKGKIDAILILTPTPQHYENALKAINARYPVICEKALASNSRECLTIKNMVDINNTYLAVIYNYSGYPAVRLIREFIRNGDLGELKKIHIEMPQETFLRADLIPQPWRTVDHDLPTVSLDLGVHVHHLISFITNGLKPVELVGIEASQGRYPGVIDEVQFLARYDNEVIVSGWWGKSSLGYRNGLSLRVFGEIKSVEWIQTAPETLTISTGSGEKITIDRGTYGVELLRQKRYNRFKAGHPAGFIEALANLYQDIATELNARFAGNNVQTGYVFGAQHAYEGLRFLELIHQSAIERQWINW